jgi:methionine-rich copper-binding protein CopC
MLKKLLKVATVAGALFAGPTFAHAKLLSASPADGAQLTEAPKTMTLSFAEAVTLASVTVISSGRTIHIPVYRTAKATATVVLPLPVLVAGAYQVRWSAVSADDGHVTKGSLAFMVRASAAPR